MARQSPKTPEPSEPSETEKAGARSPIQDAHFKKSERPGSVWQLLAWVIFEYPLLERYAQTLTRRQAIPLFCRAYLVIAFLASVLYLAGIGLTVGLELPVRFPQAYTPEIQKVFAGHRDSTRRARILIEGTASGLARGLAGGLVFGLVGSLAVSLAVGLLAVGSVGLAVGVAVGLIFGLAGGVAGRLVFGLAGGLAVGLAFGLAGGLAGGLAFIAGYTLDSHIFVL